MPVSSGQPLTPSPLSWNLTIDSTVVVVSGSMSIGTVMVQLVNRPDVCKDYSDHALWWPKSNIWLKNTKWTLDQYGIQADSHLIFTNTHKSIFLQLSDLRILSVRVDFSVSVFASVCKLCKDLGIRHAEELSFLRLPKVSNLNERRTSPRRRRQNLGTLKRYNSIGDSLSNPTLTSSITPKLPSTILINKQTDLSFQTSLSKSLNNLIINDKNLARTPITPTKNLLTQLIRPINFIEKCKLNKFWFDSSKSLMEQNIHENDLILLRFKYYSFFNLNPRLDAIRINQLYEQAKWSILTEDIDCTEEEMITFAALQLQIQIQSSTSATVVSQDDDINHDYDNTDIDQTFYRLQNSSIQSKDDLYDYLYLFQSRRFTLKSYKRYWFVLRCNQLIYYSNQSEQNSKPIEKISLKDCEILPDVNISTKKYAIRLMIPSIDGMNETIIKCSDEKQYAKWIAAFRLASKGRSINEISYETERESILALINMQISSSRHIDIQPDNYLSIKMIQKYKTKQLIERILEAHAAVSNLDGMEAKLRYLKVWQSLPEYGITTFIVKFKDSNKKEELLGIASNRLLRQTITGDTLKIWWISRMRSWNVNWENQLVTIEFDNETIQFLPLYNIDSKCIHEFLGAYIFLAMRTRKTMSDNNDLVQQEALFQQLTSAYT